jgi:hypothetical protein
VADRVRKVSYCYTKVSNRTGQGADLLGELRDEGVDLVAFSGFPIGKGRAQIDFVGEDIGAIRKVAKKKGWRLSGTKKGFLVQGTDQIGAVHRQLNRLAEAKINVIAADAVSAGGRRYGMILWVDPRNYARAAKALHAK